MSPARKSSGPTRTRHDKTELGASRFQLDSLPGVALDLDERQLLAQFHDVDSILRTEAVRPFPVPLRKIFIMRDVDMGLEPGELSGPARERAHPEGE